MVGERRSLVEPLKKCEDLKNPEKGNLSFLNNHGKRFISTVRS